MAAKLVEVFLLGANTWVRAAFAHDPLLLLKAYVPLFVATVVIHLACLHAVWLAKWVAKVIAAALAVWLVSGIVQVAID